MISNVFRLMVQGALLYLVIGWMAAFALLAAHRRATPTVSMGGLALRALVACLAHPLNLAISIYMVILRLIASLRR